MKRGILLNAISNDSIHISFLNIARYTSIGDRTNTVPNPHLKRTNAITGKDEYLHADHLIDDEYERAGRL